MNGASASTVGGEDQHQAEHAQEDRERHEPALAGLARHSPRARSAIDPTALASMIRRRRDAAAFLDHATSSFASLADAAARLVTTRRPGDEHVDAAAAERRVALERAR